MPHILIKDLVDQVMHLPGPFGDEIRKDYEDLRLKLVEEARAKFELDKKKKKPKKGEEPEVFDETKIKPRLPSDTVCKAYKWRLSQNDCRNRGYVLDGFPKDYKMAQTLFGEG